MKLKGDEITVLNYLIDEAKKKVSNYLRLVG